MKKKTIKNIERPIQFYLDLDNPIKIESIRNVGKLYSETEQQFLDILKYFLQSFKSGVKVDIQKFHSTLSPVMQKYNDINYLSEVYYNVMKRPNAIERTIIDMENKIQDRANCSDNDCIQSFDNFMKGNQQDVETFLKLVEGNISDYDESMRDMIIYECERLIGE